MLMRVYSKQMHSLFFIIFFFQLIHASEWPVNNKWPDDYNKAISKELNKDEYIEFLERKIDLSNLKNLNCTHYNNANKDEKIEFWQAFLLGLTRAESNFNPLAKSKISRKGKKSANKNAHRSFGLLQLAPDTAKRFCHLIEIDEIFDPIKNLTCGVKLLNYQLSGGKDENGNQLRPDLENKLFGKRMFLWGPLRSKDFIGRKLLYLEFKKIKLDACQNTLD
jgi:hypothetical protein